jgi:hypothetical protein
LKLFLFSFFFLFIMFAASEIHLSSHSQQPAAEPDWETLPFEVTTINGFLYGRGTSDNKGPLLAFVYAVRELQELHQVREGVQGSGFRVLKDVGDRPLAAFPLLPLIFS